MKITVIAPDKMITVDGVALECEFEEHTSYLSAVQWDGSKGTMELNLPTGFSVVAANYYKDVLPYYEIWKRKTEEIDEELAKAEKEREEYESSAEYIKLKYESAVDAWLDETVQTRGYTSILTCKGWEGDDDPIFNAEGTAARKWQSKVYRQCYKYLDEYMAGEITELPSVEEFIKMLPQIEW